MRSGNPDLRFRLAPRGPRNDVPIMIPVTSFAGKMVAVFGLGGSGPCVLPRLEGGRGRRIAGDDSADNIAKAAQAGFGTRTCATCHGRISPR